jgi:hypothetical protein
VLISCFSAGKACSSHPIWNGRTTRKSGW